MNFQSIAQHFFGCSLFDYLLDTTMTYNFDTKPIKSQDDFWALDEDEKKRLQRSIFNTIVNMSTSRIMQAYKYVANDKSFNIIFDENLLDANLLDWMYQENCRQLLKNCIESKAINIAQEYEKTDIDLMVEIRFIAVPNYGLVIYVTFYLNKRDEDFLNNVVIPPREQMEKVLQEIHRRIQDDFEEDFEEDEEEDDENQYDSAYPANFGGLFDDDERNIEDEHNIKNEFSNQWWNNIGFSNS